MILQNAHQTNLIFKNFSQFLFANLKRILLSEKVLVDLGLFKRQTVLLEHEIENLVKLHCDKYKTMNSFNQKCLELVELFKAEVRLVNEILGLLETEGILNRFLDFEAEKRESRIDDLIESILS